ncbi:hypothetical protein ACRRTK_003928 [Alexandromys fortis]
MEDHIHALGPQTNQIGTFSFSVLRTSSGSTNIKTLSHFLFCSTQIQCFAYNGCLINFYQLNKCFWDQRSAVSEQGRQCSCC